jgi:hypothetical protein
MAGITKAMTDDFFDAETEVKQQKNTFAALTDLTGETLMDSECSIKEMASTEGGVTIRTTYYNPPPNGFNWASGDGKKVMICHHFANTLVISENAVGTGDDKHSAHEGDYLGNCIHGSLEVPDDAWVTCEEEFGIVAKRLSWQQLWDM